MLAAAEDGQGMSPPNATGSRPDTRPPARHRSSRRLAGLQLADVLSRNWLVLLVRGLIAIAFGVLVLVISRVLLNVLILPFGTYVLADGILGAGIVLGERAGRGHWWVLLGWGLAGVIIGILTFFLPPGSARDFMIYIAIWAVVTGVLEIMTAVHLRKKLGAEWLLVLAGVISVAFGVSVMVLSGAGAFVLSRVIAAYAGTFGILLGVLALGARTVRLPSA